MVEVLLILDDCATCDELIGELGALALTGVDCPDCPCGMQNREQLEDECTEVERLHYGWGERDGFQGRWTVHLSTTFKPRTGA